MSKKLKKHPNLSVSAANDPTVKLKESKTKRSRYRRHDREYEGRLTPTDGFSKRDITDVKQQVGKKIPIHGKDMMAIKMGTRIVKSPFPDVRCKDVTDLGNPKDRLKQGCAAVQDEKPDELGKKKIISKVQSEKKNDGSNGDYGSDADDDDLSGLRFDSQEPLLNSSQDDSLCEVRWDCRSPETIKQLKKLRGQYNAEGVKKIVANFNDDHVKPQETSLRSLRIFMPPQVDDALANKNKLQKAKERDAKRQQQRLKSRENVQGMINLLQELAAKQRKGSEDKSTGSADSTADEKTSKSCDSWTGFSETKTNVDDDDDCWSDDDLFKDNSFLIEATQNPEKFLNTSCDLASTQKNCDSISSKQSRSDSSNRLVPVPINISSATSGTGANFTSSSQSFFNDSSVIPSSYASRGVVTSVKNPSVRPSISSASYEKSSTGVANTTAFSKPHIVQKTLPYSITNSKKTVTNGPNSYKTYTTNNLKSSRTAHSIVSGSRNSFTANSSTAFNSKCTTSVKNFVNQNSQSSIVNFPPGAKIKTSFRKFNSFQCDGSSEPKTSCPIAVKESPNSSLNTSFRKTLSFDVTSSSSSTHLNTPHKISSANGAQSQNQSKPTSSNFYGYGPNLSNRGGVRVKPFGRGQGQFSTSVSMQNHKSTASSNSYNKQLYKSNTSDMKKTETLSCNKQSEISYILNTNTSSEPNHDDGFDISLPEDVLQQLLEPDDLFDSQTDIVASGTKAPVQLTNHSSSETDIPENQTSPEANENKTLTKHTGTGSNQSLRTHDIRCGALKPNNRLPETKGKETLLSPVKPVMDVKNTHVVGLGSPMQTFFKKTFGVQQAPSNHQNVLKHRQSFGPSSSTPVKQAKKEENKTFQDHGCSDSFLESAFDDSFMNDNALYESQILPLLEKMESEATATSKPKTQAPTLPTSPVKCSPDEIEQKRQAALQRRSIRLSQKKS